MFDCVIRAAFYLLFTFYRHLTSLQAIAEVGRSVKSSFSLRNDSFPRIKGGFFKTSKVTQEQSSKF